MEQKTTNTRNKKILLIGGIALLVILAVFLTLFLTGRGGTTGTKTITVDVVVADEVVETHKIKTDAEFLGQALLDNNIIEGTSNEFGMYITAVDGRAADDANQEWWCITKGGEMVMTGVDQTPIEDGDSYELTLTVGW